jgi:hypothetical protein
MILPFGNINTNIANNKSFFPVREDSIRSDYTPLVLFPIGNKKHEPRLQSAKAIRFSTLDEICKVLNCQPGDLLEYMDEASYKHLFDS